MQATFHRKMALKSNRSRVAGMGLQSAYTMAYCLSSKIAIHMHSTKPSAQQKQHTKMLHEYETVLLPP